MTADTVFTLLAAAIFGALTLWGWVAPAVDLQRAGELTRQRARAEYTWHVRSIPRALWWAASGALRHPWSWDGPIFGWVLTVFVVLFGALMTIIYAVVGPDRLNALAWAPVFLFVGIGCGIGLVRDMSDARGDDRRSDVQR